MISFCSKLVRPMKSSISTKLFFIPKTHFKEGIHNASFKWFDKIHNILICCGFSGFRDSLNFPNSNWLVKSTKQKLTDLYINDWQNEISNSMSCYNYRIFKTTFGYESYLWKVLFKYCKYLIKIRTRNHNLPIETGRWRRILRENRKCHLCNQDIGEVQVGPDKLEVVVSFCYLGDMLSAAGGSELSTTTHVKTAWKKFKELKPVLSSCHLSFKTRGHMYSSCVRSAMLHASETWPVTKPCLQCLQRNDRAMIRQICNVKPQNTATIRSTELLARLGIEDLDLILKERRLCWYGHVERSSGAVTGWLVVLGLTAL